MKYIPREIKENVNVSHSSPIKEFFSLISILAGSIIIVYFLFGFAVDIIVPHVSPHIEKVIGGFYLQNLDGGEDEEERIKLQKLLDELAGEAPDDSRSYFIHIVDSEQINALALPGGHIVVLSRLISELGSENEIAFVLSHELGHYANRDHLRGLGRGLVLIIISLFLFGDDNQATDFLMNTMLTVDVRFSQRQETKADYFAIELLNKRYGHVAGATDFLRKISEIDSHSKLTYFFSTHPYPPERIKRVEDYIKEKGYNIE